MDIKQLLPYSCEFVQGNVNQPPARPGVYAIGTADASAKSSENPSGFMPVYIGKTNSLLRRFGEHSNTSENKAGLEGFLHSNWRRAKFIYNDEINDIKRVEKEMIARYRPKYSKRVG